MVWCQVSPPAPGTKAEPRNESTGGQAKKSSGGKAGLIPLKQKSNCLQKEATFYLQLRGGISGARTEGSSLQRVSSAHGYGISAHLDVVLTSTHLPSAHWRIQRQGFRTHRLSRVPTTSVSILNIPPPPVYTFTLCNANNLTHRIQAH